MTLRSEPRRVQLSRKKGWRKPENTVVVSRPSKWGNPYRITSESTYRHVVRGPGVFSAHDHVQDARRMAVDLFALGVGPFGAFEYDAVILDRLHVELAGKNLACWCPLDQPCHADVLLRIANKGDR